MFPLAHSLRAARALLGISQEDVAKLTGIERRMIGRIEAGNLKLVPREALKLQNEYEKKGVEFVKATKDSGPGIRWKQPGRFDAFQSAQLRAARAMLDLSQRRLAELSGIDKNFISRLEQDKLSAVSMETVRKLVSCLEAAGVELTLEGREFGVGVRMQTPHA